MTQRVFARMPIVAIMTGMAAALMVGSIAAQ